MHFRLISIRGLQVKRNCVISLSSDENVPKNPIWDKIVKTSYSGQYYTFFGLKPTQNDVNHLTELNSFLKNFYIKAFFKEFQNYDFLLTCDKNDKNSNTKNLLFRALFNAVRSFTSICVGLMPKNI